MDKAKMVTSGVVMGLACMLGACSSNPTNAQIGTGVGAVAGGLVGDALIGGPIGTLGGAAAGAFIGHEVGEDRDQGRNR